MPASSADGDNLAGQATDPYGRRAMHIGSVAKLAVAVCAPALDSAAAQERAGMSAARADRRCAALQTADAGRLVTLDVCPVSELPETIPAPALDLAGFRERAGVVAADSNGRHGAVKPVHLDGGRAIDDGAVAELAGAVGAPALDVASVGQRAGMSLAAADRDCKGSCCGIGLTGCPVSRGSDRPWYEPDRGGRDRCNDERAFDHRNGRP